MAKDAAGNIDSTGKVMSRWEDARRKSNRYSRRNTQQEQLIQEKLAIWQKMQLEEP